MSLVGINDEDEDEKDSTEGDDAVSMVCCIRGDMWMTDSSLPECAPGTGGEGGRGGGVNEGGVLRECRRLGPVEDGKTKRGAEEL